MASNTKTGFNKRCVSLMKKARELSILCDSEIAVFGYSKDGKLFEYASSNMTQILDRLEKCRKTNKSIPVNGGNPEVAEGAIALREDTEKLKLDQEDQHVLGMDLKSMNREDLYQLQQHLNEGLLCIKDKKEAILVQKLEQAKAEEQQSKQEIETLSRKVEDLERLSGMTIPQQPPLHIGYQLIPFMSNFALAEGDPAPQVACSTNTVDANLADLSLGVGCSTSAKVCGKRKTLDEGRSDGYAFLGL